MNIDSIPFLPMGVLGVLVSFLGLLIAFGGALAFTLGAEKRGIAVGALALAILVTGGYLGFTAQTRPGAEQDLVASTYGVQLDDAQVRELRWPGTAPDTREHILGTTTVLGAGRTPITIHLLWDGAQLLLVDDAGAELPRLGG